VDMGDIEGGLGINVGIGSKLDMGIVGVGSGVGAGVKVS
jgi:hypothetical protein